MTALPLCTAACERQVQCAVCGRTKPPVGRDVAAADGGYCEHECPGRHREPIGGHLWPGELARVRAEAAEDSAPPTGNTAAPL